MSQLPPDDTTCATWCQIQEEALHDLSNLELLWFILSRPFLARPGSSVRANVMQAEGLH